MRVLQLGFVPLEKGGEGSGGIATHVWELSVALREAGHDVAIMALNRLGSDSVADGIRIYHFPAAKEALFYPLRTPPSRGLFRGAAREFPKSGPKALAKACWVRRLLRDFRPTLIHSHLPAFFFMPTARAMASIPGVLTLHSVHDLTHNPKATRGDLARIRARFQDSLLESDAIIAVHPHVLDEARGLGLRWEAPARVIINAVDRHLFKPVDRAEARARLGLKRHQRLILFSGIMTRRKGEQELLRALAMTKELHCIMIGYGPLEHEARALVDSLGLSDRVRIIPPVARDRMHLFYSAADVFALPSHSEGFALSYMESLLSGTPFLADRDIPREMVSPEACVLVDAKDPRDIARGLKEALSKAWDRKAIVRFGERFAWGPEKVGEYLDVYQEAKARFSGD